MRFLIMVVSMLLLQSGGCGGKNSTQGKGVVKEAREKYVEALAGISEGTKESTESQKDEQLSEIPKHIKVEIPKDGETMALSQVIKGVTEASTALSVISATLESDADKLVRFSVKNKPGLELEIAKMNLLLNEAAASGNMKGSDLFISATKAVKELEGLVAGSATVYEDEIKDSLDKATEAFKKYVEALKKTT